jgi:hypothetical protein
MDWVEPVAVVHITRRGMNARTFAHEVGHVFDMYVLGPTGGRETFAAIIGETWSSPATSEKFADAYALCAVHARISGTWRTSYGLRLNTATHAQVCSLIRDSYARWLADPEAQVYGQLLH